MVIPAGVSPHTISQCFLVTLAGVEPATSSSASLRSIQLSYRAIVENFKKWCGVNLRPQAPRGFALYPSLSYGTTSFIKFTIF